MTPVDTRSWVFDDVLDIEPTLGTLEPARAAALYNPVLALPMNLYPARHVWIPLRLELVRGRERTHRSAVKAADENLFTAF